MRAGRSKACAVASAALLAGLAPLPAVSASTPMRVIGQVDVKTVPVPVGIVLLSATYTPSGKVLVSYADQVGSDLIRLATMDDDGANFRPFFEEVLPPVAKNNGIRYMVFPDNRRIFTGDYVVECRTSLETCQKPELLPVQFPAQVAGNDAVMNRWSEIITAPDNRHVAWTTLIARSAMVLVGTIRRDGAHYLIDDAAIVSTLDPTRPDPAHKDGVIPVPIVGGEVKQFVGGGTALSSVAMGATNLPGSMTRSLVTGARAMITNPPGYTETTIFSPDERLGLTMTTRFSTATSLGALNLMPLPYPDSLNMGLSYLVYTYGVTGVRRARAGSIGPALIDVAAARARPDYMGIDLARDPGWSFYSPMSWHPGGKRAMWIEGKNNDTLRIRTVLLPNYRPGKPVVARPTPARPAKASDLSQVDAFVKRGYALDAKVYGRKSGYLTYKRGPTGDVEKRYFDFSDDARRIYSGVETMKPNPRGESTYAADVRLSGAEHGVMKLTVTFGPVGGTLPAKLIFDRDAGGNPKSGGYTDYNGKRLTIDTQTP